MSSQMATPSYTPDVTEDVDFMFMFMSQQQNDELAAAATQEQQTYMHPALPATGTDLALFDNNMYAPMTTPALAAPTASLAVPPPPTAPAAPLAAPIVPPTGYPMEPTPSMPILESASVTTPIPRPATAPSTAATPIPALQATAVMQPSSNAVTPVSSHTSPVQSEAAEATRQPGRRKRKLTPEDKRRICEIYRNSQGKIRQEDIAKEYSVDRSTISKILNQEERWLDPDVPGANSLLSRRPGGRYPAIEEEMHRWLDDAVMHGREVRDSEAREEALRIGLRLGHPHFQASSKWWDGVKRRRVEEGRPMPTARRHAITPPMGMPGLVRSYSAMAMDPYPREVFPMGVAGPSHHPYAILPAHLQYPVAMRSRSQSSPQVMPPNFNPAAFAAQPSAFGPARTQRFSPGRQPNAAALRQWTFPNGAAPAAVVARPLSRGGSSQGQVMGPHAQLGASAFGMATATPTELAPPAEISGDSMHVPALSQSSGMSPLSISISESSDVTSATTLSPDTPRTPAQPTFTNVPPMTLTTECVDMNVYNQFQPPLYAPPSACLPGAGEVQYIQQPLYPGFIQAQW